MKHLALMLVVVALGGCATLSGLVKTNEEQIASLSSGATGAGCVAAAQKLTVPEGQIVCANLSACVPAFCATPVPTASAAKP